MIELINFSKKYKNNDDFTVQNVNLIAKEGSVTGLLGLNGEGKTTIIRAICAQHYASSGSIKISDANGTFYDAFLESDKIKKIIGYVPEVNFLPLNKTVLEFFDYCSELYALTEKEKIKNIEKIINYCELETVLEKKIYYLSKGFKQRVSFAAALIHNPPNLILDEVVNGFDPAQIIQFRKVIKELAKEKTVLISTHLMQEVQALCENIYILSKGKIADSGTEQQLINKTSSKSIEEAFLKITNK